MKRKCNSKRERCANVSQVGIISTVNLYGLPWRSLDLLACMLMETNIGGSGEGLDCTCILQKPCMMEMNDIKTEANYFVLKWKKENMPKFTMRVSLRFFVLFCLFACFVFFLLFFVFFLLLYTLVWCRQ